MNTENVEQEIKIKIVRGNTDIAEESEESLPASSAGKPEKEIKFFNPEKLAIFFFYALVFLMPVFVLPLAVAPLASGKAILFFGGILLTAFFWIFSALVKGSVKIPKSALLVSLGAVVSVWLASALSSDNAGLSLLGKLYDLDTFSVMLAAGLALFFGSIIFQSEKRVFGFYFLLFCSSFVVFSFQLLHLVFAINIIPFNIFPYATSNLIGGWNDFSIFFGFIGLVSLAFLKSATLDIAKKSLKDNVVLGTGPNTFVYDWLKFKPAAVNNTIFWIARFNAGFGYLP